MGWLFYARGLLDEDSLEKRPRSKRKILRELQESFKYGIFPTVITGLKYLKMLPSLDKFSYYEDEQHTKLLSERLTKVVMKEIKSLLKNS